MPDTPIPVKFKYGELKNLDTIEPSADTNGTVYVAKTDNNRAYMYVDFNGIRYDITSPNRVYYGISNDEDPTKKTANVKNFILEQGATVTILFTAPFNIGSDTTLNINSTGNIKIVYRGNRYYSRQLPANSVYTFIYINGQYHLIGDLDQVNNGISVRTSQFPAYETPILISSEVIPENIKSTTAITNPAIPIKANVNTGVINAPGGFHSQGELYIYNKNNNTYFLIDPKNGYINWYGVSPNSDIYGNWAFHNTGNSFIIEDMGNDINLSINSNDDSQQIISGWDIKAPEINATGDIISNGYRLPNVYYGIDEPSSSLGKDGDIYIMYS